jgi:hypothetical protein
LEDGKLVGKRRSHVILKTANQDLGEKSADHRNRIPLDDRLENLRPATNREQGLNRHRWKKQYGQKVDTSHSKYFEVFAAEKRAAVEACFARFKAEMRAAMAGGKGAGELLGAAEAALERRQEETREAHAAEVKMARSAADAPCLRSVHARALLLHALLRALTNACALLLCLCGAGEQEFGGEDGAPGGAVRAQAPGAPRAHRCRCCTRAFQSLLCSPLTACVCLSSVLFVAGGERREGGEGEGAEGAERAVRGSGAEGRRTHFVKSSEGARAAPAAAHGRTKTRILKMHAHTPS